MILREKRFRSLERSRMRGVSISGYAEKRKAERSDSGALRMSELFDCAERWS
jgi:hypothetical protein